MGFNPEDNKHGLNFTANAPVFASGSAVGKGGLPCVRVELMRGL